MQSSGLRIRKAELTKCIAIWWCRLARACIRDRYLVQCRVELPVNKSEGKDRINHSSAVRFQASAARELRTVLSRDFYATNSGNCVPWEITTTHTAHTNLLEIKCYPMLSVFAPENQCVLGFEIYRGRSFIGGLTWRNQVSQNYERASAWQFATFRLLFSILYRYWFRLPQYKESSENFNQGSF